MVTERDRDRIPEECEFDHFIVSNLVETSGPLETIESDAPIQEALSKMLKKQYSQLPVFQNHVCIGSVTLESILRVVLNQARKSKLGTSFLDWPVRRFIDTETNYASPNDGILEHAEIMANRGYVLVGNPTNIKGISTNYDLVLFLKRKTEPFLLLREIETSLRYVISKKVGHRELEETLKSIRTENGSDATAIDKLTLNDLRQLVKTRWSLLKDVFLDYDKTDAQLRQVCQLRNQILHFRGHLTASHLYQLRTLRNRYVKIALESQK